jgi:hypothetical protein
MTNIKRALLLVGSPRVEKSTSASLGNYLISKLEESGITSETLFIYRIINREETIEKLFQAIEGADLIILTFPLYVDSLPAPVIKTMEVIKRYRDTFNTKKTQRFTAIVNNGFPEGSQNSIALQICKIFAKESGFLWKGGLSLGGGGAVNGVPLLERPGMLRNVIKGLDIAAQALKEDSDIPQEAIEYFSKQFIPSVFYRSMGNLGWRMQAKQYKKKQKLKHKPYANL